MLEQGPAATEEAASLADRQFWWRGDKIELRCLSMFLAAEQSWKPWLLGQRSQGRRQYLSGREERAHPLHWRQRRRQEGSSILIKEKEQQGRGIEDEGQKQGSGAQYPWLAPGSMEDCRELWCDEKWLPQVQIYRLSLVRVLGYCWDRPTVL